MDATTDLTDFFLAWKKMCSIRLCLPEHEHKLRNACMGDFNLFSRVHEINTLAEDVMKSSNRDFEMMLHLSQAGMRRSLFENEVESWRNGAGSAFELMEGHLYAKEKLNGKAFKSYLFENIATRSGGISKNLYGYLQRTWRTLAKESFGENVYEPVVNDDGDAIEPRNISYDGKHEAIAIPTPDEQLEIKEAVARFCRFLDKETPSWEQDHWIVLFCVLNVIAIGGQRVRKLYIKGHDTINTIGQRLRSTLITYMRETCPDLAIARAMNGEIQRIVDEKMREMPFFGVLMKIREENRKSTGK